MNGIGFSPELRKADIGEIIAWSCLSQSREDSNESQGLGKRAAQFVAGICDWST